MNQNFKERLRSIRCFVFDIDGVLTDGGLDILQDGTMLRRMNIKDGYALKLAQDSGYPVFVISGSNAEGVLHRLNNLGIDEVFLKVPNKLAVLEGLLIKHRIPMSEVLYMGDDMPDLDVMHKVGCPVCPADAVHQVKAISVYVSEYKGGWGAARDVIEQVLTLHGKWK